jgi:cardiolipin synthase
MAESAPARRSEADTDLVADGDADLERVVTIPNAVTAVRLALVPVFVWLLFGARQQASAAVLLGVLGATDWVDGFLARRLRQVSTVGKVLDPTADRILVATAVISILVHGAVPLWFGVATIVREAVVSVAVLVLASLGARRIDVIFIGKAGTFALMFAYPAFLLGDGRSVWQSEVTDAAWVVGMIGLVLAWGAAAAYVPLARRALAARTRVPEERAARGMR